MALFAALLAGGAAPLGAQTPGFSMSVRDTPVRMALEKLVELTGISLVYSSEVVEGRHTVCRAEAAQPEDLLRCISAGAGLDFYRLSSGTYVVIEAPEQLPAFASLSGRILDALTGEPIEDAVVVAEGWRAGISTNRAGHFSLPKLAPGPTTLRVSRTGYAPTTLRVSLGSFESARREVRLEPEVVHLAPMIVDGRRTEHLGGPVFSAAEGSSTGRVVSRGDVATEVRRGMGVSRRPLFADLSVQGSAPGEHMIRLDGVPVFDPVALGRARSAFSPLAIRSVRVHSAGFGVAAGSLTGGVIELEQATTDREGPPGATVFMDPFSVSADLSTPLRIGAAEGSMMVTGRRSLWGVFEEPSLARALRDWNRVDPVLLDHHLGGAYPGADASSYLVHGHSSDVVFSDLHAVADLRLPGFRSLRASVYRGTNRVGTELFSSGADPASGSDIDRLVVGDERYDWSNTAAQLSFDMLVGERGSLRVRGWASRSELDHDARVLESSEIGLPLGSIDVASAEARLRSAVSDLPESGDGNRVGETGLEVGGDVVLGDGHTLRAAVEAAHFDSRLRLALGLPTPLQSVNEGWRFAGYVLDRWKIGRSATLETGVRLTSLPGAGTYAEPRASLRFDGYDGTLGPWSAGVSGGVYRQFLDQFDLTSTGPTALVPSVQFWIPNDGWTEPPRARHLAADVVVHPLPELELRVEAYHKWLDRILALDYRALVEDHGSTPLSVDPSHFVAATSGVAYGAGVRARWRRGRMYVEGRFDGSVSERAFPSRFGGAAQPTPWNEPRRLEAEARLPIVYGLALEGESRTVWGRSWALRRAYYDFLPFASDGPPVGAPGDDRLPTLHQLDLGISWLGRVGSVLTEVRVQGVNLAGRQVLDYSLVRSGPEGSTSWTRAPRFLPPPALFVSVRVGL